MSTRHRRNPLRENSYRYVAPRTDIFESSYVHSVLFVFPKKLYIFFYVTYIFNIPWNQAVPSCHSYSAVTWCYVESLGDCARPSAFGFGKRRLVSLRARASGGRLGIRSLHDPHSLVYSGGRPESHQSQGLLAERSRRSPGVRPRKGGSAAREVKYQIWVRNKFKYGT